MNSYQKLKEKHRKEKQQLLDDIEILMSEDVGYLMKMSVKQKYEFKKQQEKAVWFGSISHDKIDKIINE